MFGLLRQGDGKVVITASFGEKMQVVRLPQMETVPDVWDFLEILFEELRCEIFYEKGGKSAFYSQQQPQQTQHQETPKLPVPSAKRRLEPTASGSAEVSGGATAQQQQPKRGRPLGSKSKSSSKQQKAQQLQKALTEANQHLESTSPNNKRVPIYHNAHTLYQKQLDSPIAAGAAAATSAPAQLQTQTPTAQAQVAPQQQQQPPVKLSLGQQLKAQAAAKKAAGGEDGGDPYAKFARHRLPEDANEWTVEQVIGHLSHLDPSLAVHVESFRQHEIDGKALLLLSESMLMKYIDMKLGPALKVCNIVEMLQGKKCLPLPHWNV